MYAKKLLNDLLNLKEQIKKSKHLELGSKINQFILKANPEMISDDNFLNEWTKLQLNDANKLRKENKYLESGIKFISIAKHSKNYSRKSEYYYKGALLLYRGGQRRSY